MVIIMARKLMTLKTLKNDLKYIYIYMQIRHKNDKNALEKLPKKITNIC